MITPRVLFLLAHGAAHLEHYLPPMRTLDVLDFDYLRFIPRRIRFAFPWVHLFHSIALLGDRSHLVRRVRDTGHSTPHDGALI